MEQYDIPVIHLDFAEMPKDVLQKRAVCMLTEGKVPYHAIETGDWRRNPEWTKLVRSLWNRVKKLQMFYYNIGNLNPSQIFSLIRRVAYSEIGIDKKFVIHYDYLKPFDDETNSPEWKQMGHFIHDFKSFLSNEIPQASVWTSLQLNKSGITTNKSSKFSHLRLCQIF